ncbi:MAG: ribonuclease P protein component, partial [Pseudomonadota bacterium]
MIIISTLKKRADFLAAARGRKSVLPSMIVQARARNDDSGACRVGYTCSKRVGNAVTRNRAKRRLRAAAHEIISVHGKPGWDYVLIGRASGTVSLPFSALLHDLSRAVESSHRHGARKTPPPHASD